MLLRRCHTSKQPPWCTRDWRPSVWGDANATRSRGDANATRSCQIPCRGGVRVHVRMLRAARISSLFVGAARRGRAGGVPTRRAGLRHPELLGTGGCRGEWHAPAHHDARRRAARGGARGASRLAGRAMAGKGDAGARAGGTQHHCDEQAAASQLPPCPSASGSGSRQRPASVDIKPSR